MTQARQPANPSSGPDCSGLLITYMDEEVDETWKVHPRHALRMNYLTEKERYLFETFMPKVHRQDEFFDVLDEARKTEELPSHVLEKLIEPVPPKEIPKGQDGKHLPKRHRFISRTDTAPDSKQHLVRRLKSQKYLGTRGIPCDKCEIVICHDDDLKRHQETKHGIPRVKKQKAHEQTAAVATGESSLLPQTNSRPVDATAEYSAVPHPSSICITDSSNATVIIRDNQPSQTAYESNRSNLSFAPHATHIAGTHWTPRRPRDYGTNFHRFRPYSSPSMRPLAHHSTPLDPWWRHDSQVNSSLALTSPPPNVFPFMEFDTQFSEMESGLMHQDANAHWLESTNSPPAYPVVQASYTYNGIPPLPLQQLQQQPCHNNYISTPLPPAMLPTPAPPHGGPWSNMIPTSNFVPQIQPLGPSAGSVGLGGDTTPSPHYFSQWYAPQSPRSSETQWEKRQIHRTKQAYDAVSWCSSSDRVYRLANVFYPTLALLLTTGVFMLLIFILTLQFEDHVMEVQWLTLAS
ncbi:hypothetical protein FRC18_003174 [Serendipita sp. 400]|nr:hypothetical protein FRC18_003174 [Serendipita sp. 400]